MSRTFSSRPSVQTRGRGGHSTRSRGRSREGNILGSSSEATPSGAEVPKEGIRGNPNYGPERRDSETNNHQPEDPQRGQYAGGFTMFAPNERKRQEVAQMAQRETANYEQYKQQNTGKVYRHVGTVGGGELTEDQVRNRQANAVRAQKYNRQVKQAGYREAAKRAEEEQIEAKRAEARRKSEQNLMRQGKAPAADEVRRKREAFLQQLESSNASTEQPPQPRLREAEPKRQPPPQNVKPQVKAAPAGTVYSSRAVRTAARATATQQQVTRRSPTTRNSPPQFRDSVGCDTPVKPKMHIDELRSDHADLQMVSAMFPHVEQGYLNDLLYQMGSADAVIDMLAATD
ncbi:epithelial-stromal interaction protein 1 isoform X2 [Aplysia californica]|uniref:Epithelial-stromal interaction protein 1 isoform X2 n=1 Tax=Aplysia californica TaxID=6500 RepID=A0ABM1A7A6_APLCA|nr:epithelial-stromal interaction protein 1 isoform X2 [Aplysia californica]